MSSLRIHPGVLSAYLLMIVTGFIANFHLVPVYAHMMIATLCTIYIGCIGSVKEEKVKRGEVNTPPAEQMQTKDAMMFPVIGSAVLFSLYLVFKFLPKEWVNFVIKIYFFIFGILVLGQKLSQLYGQLLPLSLVTSLTAKSYVIPNPFENVNFAFWQKKETTSTPASTPATPATPPEEPFSVTILDVFALFTAGLLGVWYIMTNHWASSNIFGIAFSIQGIEMLSLGSYLNGAILLSGLFIYDIFWVFGTDVMVTVAKSFDAPIKLLFPQTSAALSPSMLGLGDIVIPGIFIALCMRYDYHRYNLANPNATPSTSSFAVPTPYFWTVFVSYFLGLTTTVFVMYAFQHAQPALLYLVPACLGGSILYGLIAGDFKNLWNYSESEEATPAVPVVEDKKGQ